MTEDLEQQNARLKRTIIDLTLDKLLLITPSLRIPEADPKMTCHLTAVVILIVGSSTPKRRMTLGFYSPRMGFGLREPMKEGGERGRFP